MSEENGGHQDLMRTEKDIIKNFEATGLPCGNSCE
jgi:hypothetical protein